jgi:YVTN family beta-propeller protein
MNPLRTYCLLFLAAAVPAAFAQPFLYVANQNASTVSVVDTRTNNLVVSPVTSFSPAGAALTPDGARLFVANPNGNLITIYNTANNLLSGTLAIGQAPASLAFDNVRLYATLSDSAAVAVFNPNSLALLATIRVGFGPLAVAVSSSTGRVFVANAYSDTVSVIDPARIGTVNNPVIATIPVAGTPVALAVSANGNSVWVLSNATPTLSRINAADAVVETRIPLPVEGAALTISPDNARVYVTGYGPSVVPVTVADGRVGAPVALPGCTAPRCLAMGAAISADGRTLYVANTSRNQIAVVDLERGQVTANVNVQASPRALVLGLAPRPATSSVEGEQ